MQDMTNDERAIMQKHVDYWKPFVADGTVIVLGPVRDPAGGYGVAVVAVDEESVIRDLIAKDPASGLNTYDVFPMMAVYKT